MPQVENVGQDQVTPPEVFQIKNTNFFWTNTCALLMQIDLYSNPLKPTAYWFLPAIDTITAKNI